MTVESSNGSDTSGKIDFMIGQRALRGRQGRQGLGRQKKKNKKRQEHNIIYIIFFFFFFALRHFPCISSECQYSTNVYICILLHMYDFSICGSCANTA